MPWFFKQGLVLRPLPLGAIVHTDSFKRTLRIRQAYGFDYSTAEPTLDAPRQGHLTSGAIPFSSTFVGRSPMGTGLAARATSKHNVQSV